MLRKLWSFLSERECHEWTIRNALFSKPLIEGGRDRGLLMTRVVCGKREFRRATLQEKLDYMESDAF